MGQNRFGEFGSYANGMDNNDLQWVICVFGNRVKLNCPDPTSQIGAVELKKWVKLSLKNKALRHRQKIFTTNNHYEWSKNQSCRICHFFTSTVDR